MSMYDHITSTMSELTQVISLLRPPIRPRLRPPTSIEEILAAEKELGLNFPDELRALLTCHNGQHSYSTEADYADPVIPSIRYPTGMHSYCWLAGIEEIVENTLHLRESYTEYLKDEEFDIYGPTRNHDNCIVFTVTENADWLVLDLDPIADGKSGQVVMQCTQPCELIVVADGIASFLQLLLDGYKSGRFKFDSDRYFVLYRDD